MTLSFGLDDDLEPPRPNCTCKKCGYWIYGNSYIETVEEAPEWDSHFVKCFCSECKSESYYSYTLENYGDSFLGLQIPWRRVKSTMMVQEIVSIEPMTLPDGLLFYLHTAFGENKNER